MPNNIKNWDVWKNRPIHSGQHFIEDGAIDIKKWNEEKIKILFLMKEAYGRISNLKTHLQNKSQKGTFGKASTFYNVVQWSDAIREVNNNNTIPDFSECHKDLKSIERIAVVNIKKSNGEKRSSKNDLKAYVKSDWDLLENQILNLKPDFIVCCGTFDLIKNNVSWYKDSECRNGKMKWEELPGAYFINFVHPAMQNLKHAVSYYAIAAVSSPKITHNN